MPPLTPSQIAIVKSTAPLLAIHGTTITTSMYNSMLAGNPSLKSIFSSTHQATGAQPRALAGSLYAYATHIDDLGALSPAVALICHKHASLGIAPEQYKVVATYLMAALTEVLGKDVFQGEVEEAWGAAYWQLADIMIDAEANLYKAARWQGWKDFKVVKKEPESAEITSFYLQPVDGAELPVWKPGQYISVQTEVRGLGEGVLQARQYSLSDAPGKGYLRISVKRESGLVAAEPGTERREPGWVSNVLHAEKEVGDVVRVSHPYGDFYLEVEGKDTPVVLISGGVGMTSLLGMLNALVESGSKRKVSWIHAARNASVRAFKGHVEDVVKKSENAHAVLFNTFPEENEVVRDGVIHGRRLNLEKVDKEKDLFLGEKGTEYFVCGPEQFMVDMETKLKEFGVDAGQINMELFGTGGVPRL
jgi:nitric oxide dioxygenase